MTSIDASGMSIVRDLLCPATSRSTLKNMLRAFAEALIDAKLTKLQFANLEGGEKVFE